MFDTLYNKRSQRRISTSILHNKNTTFLVSNNLFSFKRRNTGSIPGAFVNVAERAYKRFGDFCFDPQRLKRLFNSVSPPRVPSSSICNICNSAIKASTKIPITAENSVSHVSPIWAYLNSSNIALFATTVGAGVVVIEYMGIDFIKLKKDGPAIFCNDKVNSSEADPSFDSIYDIRIGYDVDSAYYNENDLYAEETIVVDNFLNKVKQLKSSSVYENFTDTCGLTISNDYNRNLRNYISRKQMFIEKNKLLSKNNQTTLELGLLKIKPVTVTEKRLDLITRLKSEKLMPVNSNFYLE